MGGQDKGLLPLNQIPLYRHVLKRLQPQVDQVLISANRNLEEYRCSGCPVISDSRSDFQGPLAGILAGLQYIDEGYLLVVPCDTPNLPRDLLPRFLAALEEEGSGAVIAHDGERLQPLFALVPKSCQASLENYLNAGQRRVSDWFMCENAHVVLFEQGQNAFKNANTLEDFADLADKNN